MHTTIGEAELREKLAQAHDVIAHLIGLAALDGPEARRAAAYFGSDAFDPRFLPWPRHDEDGMRPDQLNAANDD